MKHLTLSPIYQTLWLKLFPPPTGPKMILLKKLSQVFPPFSKDSFLLFFFFFKSSNGHLPLAPISALQLYIRRLCFCSSLGLSSLSLGLAKAPTFGVYDLFFFLQFSYMGYDTFSCSLEIHEPSCTNRDWFCSVCQWIRLEGDKDRCCSSLCC